MYLYLIVPIMYSDIEFGTIKFSDKLNKIKYNTRKSSAVGHTMPAMSKPVYIQLTYCVNGHSFARMAEPAQEPSRLYRYRHWELSML